METLQQYQQKHDTTKLNTDALLNELLHEEQQKEQQKNKKKEKKKRQKIRQLAEQEGVTFEEMEERLRL